MSFEKSKMDYSPPPQLALGAIGCADARYGIPAIAVRVRFAIQRRIAPE
jgi:hypothetical protein